MKKFSRIYCNDVNEFKKICKLLNVDYKHEIIYEENPILLFENYGLTHCAGTKQYCKDCILCDGVYKDFIASELIHNYRKSKLERILKNQS